MADTPSPKFKLPGFDPMQDRARSIKSGRNAQASGASLQRDIDAANAWYRAKGLGVVTEIPVATRHAGGQSGLRELVASTGNPDYIGFLTIDGVRRPVSFDAKNTTGHTHFGPSFFSNPKLRATLSKQAAFLLDFAQQGGIAGMVCLDRDIGEGGCVFWIAAHHLEPFTKPAFISGFAKPEIPLRRLQGGFETPHPHRILTPAARDVIGGRVPLIDYRDLIETRLSRVG